MKNAVLITAALSIFINNVTCFIWENLLIDTFNVKAKPIKSSNETEKYLNMTQLATLYGYCAEEYAVRTADGYVLALGRVAGRGPPLLVMHGFINAAHDYMTSGRDSLIFVLADAGYDVWYGNARGNTYSKKHVTLSPADKQFWNFTFHEIGIYDLPAMIDFVLMKTGETQVTYIGQSQATTASLILTSLSEEYNKKMKCMVCMATIAWTGNLRSPLARVSQVFRDLIYYASESIGVYQFLPSNALTQFIFRDVCGSSKLALLICETFLFSLYGFDYPKVHPKAANQLAHFPSGASMKQLFHYNQLMASGEFRQFDNGRTRNLQVYGTETPPDYPVHKITTPIYVMYALNDWLSDVKDLKIFLKHARSVSDVYRVPWERWSHMDYLWGKDAKRLVYDKMLQWLSAKA